jgi:hypothetical protein
METKTKLERLFAAAKTEIPPRPRDEWAGDVLRAVRQDRARVAPDALLGDIIAGLLPRVALGSAALMLLCLAADLALSSGQPDLQADVAAAADEFLFVAR